MKKSLLHALRGGLAILLSILFSSGSLQAQSTRKLRHEVVVYILKDSLLFPAQQPGKLLTSSSVLLKSNQAGSALFIRAQSLARAFQKLNVVSITKAFASKSEQDTVTVREDGRRVKTSHFNRMFVLELPSEAAADSAVKMLSKLPSVLYVERHSEMIPFQDPAYDGGQQWGLNNDGRNGGTARADIHAAEAWQLYTGCTCSTIGIIDTGVETTHQDLAGKTIGDGDIGGIGHGTHVAGIAGAIAHNNLGGRGIDWNARLVSKRIFDANGYVGDAVAAQQIVAAANETNVLNNSFGGPQYSTTLHAAFAYAYKRGRVSVASMGNDALNGNSTKYPGAFGQGVIAVGATQNNDIRSAFSQTGPHIDLVAPGGSGHLNGDGTDILSTWIGNAYRDNAGTSMATPLVSGTASLLVGFGATPDPEDTKNLLRLSADKVGAVAYTNGFNPEMGYGRLNARRALDLLRAPNSLNRSQAYGGSDVGNTGLNWVAIGINNLNDGTYSVRRHEVRNNVTFPWSFTAPPSVWCRSTTQGFSIGNPNFGMGYGDVIAGTVTTTGATLRTYVYEVYDQLGRFVGWYPNQPSQVVLQYTALGIMAPLSVSIIGDSQLTSGDIGNWTAKAMNGNLGIYSYHWYKKNATSTIWTDTGVTTNTYSSSITRSIDLRVDVTSGGQTASATKRVTYSTTPPCPTRPCPARVANSSETLPQTYVLGQNVPNPSDGITTIDFELPEDSPVLLTVHELISGKEIARLVNERKVAGYHQVSWNASLRSNGTYVYQMTAGAFRQTKKIILLK